MSGTSRYWRSKLDTWLPVANLNGEWELFQVFSKQACKLASHSFLMLLYMHKEHVLRFIALTHFASKISEFLHYFQLLTEMFSYLVMSKQHRR